jgi:hypothetical protein
MKIEMKNILSRGSPPVLLRLRYQCPYWAWRTVSRVKVIYFARWLRRSRSKSTQPVHFGGSAVDFPIPKVGWSETSPNFGASGEVPTGQFIRWMSERKRGFFISGEPHEVSIGMIGTDRLSPPHSTDPVSLNYWTLFLKTRNAKLCRARAACVDFLILEAGKWERLGSESDQTSSEAIEVAQHAGANVLQKLHNVGINTICTASIPVLGCFSSYFSKIWRVCRTSISDYWTTAHLHICLSDKMPEVHTCNYRKVFASAKHLDRDLPILGPKNQQIRQFRISWISLTRWLS